MEIKACVFDIDHTRRELQAHGTPEFPCAAYETLYTAGPEGDICWHWHEDMELWQVLEGEMELRVPGRALLLRAGDCAAVNRNVLHAGETPRSCRLRALVFSSALVTGGADTVFARRYLRPLNACAAFDACALGAEEGRAFAREISTALRRFERRSLSMLSEEERTALVDTTYKLWRSMADELEREENAGCAQWPRADTGSSD